MTRHIIRALVATALALGAAGLAHAQQALRFSSFEPPVAFITKEILTPWAADVSKASEGRLKIDMYPGGTLGRDPAAQLKLVLDGVVDLAWVVAGYTPGRFDDTTLVELPFIARSTREGSFALTRMLAGGRLNGFDGIKVIGIFATPPTEIQSNYPVLKPADLKDKKFRAAGPNQLAMLRELGAVPVGGIAAPQVAESMQRGLIDGALAEWNAMASFRIAEVSNHHLRIPMGSVAFMVVMNKAKYDALEPAAKAVLDRFSGEAFAEVFSSKLDARNDEVAALIAKDPKHKVTLPSPVETAVWKSAVAGVEAEWVKADKRRFDLLATFKAEIEKVRAAK